MPEKTKKLVLVGDSAFAEIAHEYFEADTEYEVVAFSVESAYLKRERLRGLPVTPFEFLARDFPPSEHEVFVAVVYTQLNRLRTRLMAQAKLNGYCLASYVSPHAFVWRNVRMGEHCFVFENNVVQPFASIGCNVVLWSGNHIGHHTVIHDNCFVSSHVVVSGFCEIGEASFLGVNATIGNNVRVARDNWIGPGIVLLKDTEPGQLYGADHAEPSKVSSLRFFKVRE